MSTKHILCNGPQGAQDMEITCSFHELQRESQPAGVGQERAETCQDKGSSVLEINWAICVFVFSLEDSKITTVQFV